LEDGFHDGIGRGIGAARRASPPAHDG
jgi:hypothetical protein